MAEARRSIGRYEIERLLGQGGMGRVHLARDTVLGRRVAIKTLRDDLSLPPRALAELVERMRHEARAAAAVSHPSIVTLHDMGEDPEAGLYLVFEYVSGEGTQGEPESLRDRLKRGPLPLTEVAKLARELGSALTFAHEAGVVHRDVKPENVLFSRTGAKIADFGIARIPESTITRVNTVLGTPAYTAPEALSKGDFGPASDQFSLAATIYEAITAVRAFGGEDAIATAGRVSNDAPPPIAETIASEAVLKNLEAVLQRGMAKAPQDRFPSCAELGEAVGKAIDPPPLPEVLEVERSPLSSRMVIITERGSVPPGPGEAARPSILIRQRTHRSQNIVAAIALLVIVVLVLVGRRSSQQAKDAAADAGVAPTPAETGSSTTTSAARPATRARPAQSRGTGGEPTSEDAGRAPEVESLDTDTSR
jgi:serine/threonine-protein kinase